MKMVNFGNNLNHSDAYNSTILRVHGVINITSDIVLSLIRIQKV